MNTHTDHTDLSAAYDLHLLGELVAAALEQDPDGVDARLNTLAADGDALPPQPGIDLDALADAIDLIASRI